jgi:hypothetical protein
MTKDEPMTNQQQILDRRMARMANAADTAGWAAYAEALRARVGRKPAKTWTAVLQKALGDAYDPQAPQADKAARAAWLFARAFADERYQEPEALASYLHTTAYWCERHLAAAGADVKAKPAPKPAAKAAAAKPAPKRKPKAKAKSPARQRPAKSKASA